MSKNFAIAAVAVLVSVVASTLIARSHGPAQRANPPSVGRYMLVPVQITTESRVGSLEPEHTVFKIDTATGQTWKWISMFDSQKHESIEGWTPAAEEKTFTGKPEKKEDR